MGGAYSSFSVNTDFRQLYLPFFTKLELSTLTIYIAKSPYKHAFFDGANIIGDNSDSLNKDLSLCLPSLLDGTNETDINTIMQSAVAQFLAQ